MPVQPRKKQENIAFFEQRNPIWAANVATLGLNPQEIGQLDTLTTAARAAYDAAQLAAAQARSATIDQNLAFMAMRDLGGELIKKIRVTAEQTGNPALFALAQIPAPKEPAPIAPVEASNLAFTLQPSGALEISWDGSVSTGTTYVVQRAITPAGGGQGPFQSIGFADEKRFVDTGIPAGTERASYVVRARKGATLTPGTAPITVRFVAGGNGVSLAEAA